MFLTIVTSVSDDEGDSAADSEEDMVTHFPVSVPPGQAANGRVPVVLGQFGVAGSVRVTRSHRVNVGVIQGQFGPFGVTGDTGSASGHEVTQGQCRGHTGSVRGHEVTQGQFRVTRSHRVNVGVTQGQFGVTRSHRVSSGSRGHTGSASGHGWDRESGHCQGWICRLPGVRENITVCGVAPVPASTHRVS